MSSAEAVQVKGFAVVFQVDVVADLTDEDFYAGEGAAADGLAGDDPEPGLDLVDPGGSLGGDVEMHSWMLGQRGLDLGRGVRGEVVQHDVDILAPIGFHGLFQERQECRTVTDRSALTQDLPGSPRSTRRTGSWCRGGRSRECAAPCCRR